MFTRGSTTTHGLHRTPPHRVLIREDAAKQLAVPLRETVKQEREPSLGPPSPSPGSFALPLSTAPGVTVQFTDVGTLDTHNVTFAWGDDGPTHVDLEDYHGR